MFRDVKVGDVVYFLSHKCIVGGLDKKAFWVNYNGEDINVTFDGRLEDDNVKYPPTFFWQPVHIEAPPRPKRKVTKYLMVYQHRDEPWAINTVLRDGVETPIIYDSLDQAKKHECDCSQKYAYAPIEVEE